MNFKYIIISLALLCSGPGFSQSYSIPDGKNEDAAGWLHFRQNDGQLLDHEGNTVSSVQYYCSQLPSEVYLHDNSLVSWVASIPAVEPDTLDTLARIDMQAMTGVGESRVPVTSTLVAEDDNGPLANYYFPHCSLEDVLSYDRLTWPNIYPYIHQQLYSNASGYKIYYIIEPGGDPNDIRIEFTGQDQMNVTSSKMDFYLSSMQITLDNALAYEIDGNNAVVSVSWTPTFSQNNDGTVSIGTGSYNTNNKLVIQIGNPAAATPAVSDPRNMEHSTFVSGNNKEYIKAIFTDDNSNVYGAGNTNSTTYPGFSGLQNLYEASTDAFAVKFSSILKQLNYTYLGSSKDDDFNCGAITANGHVYLAGQSAGVDFRLEPGGNSSNQGQYSGIVCRLNTDLKLMRSRYFGGTWYTNITDLVVRGNGVVIVGQTNSHQYFPRKTVSGYYDQGPKANTNQDAFVAKLDVSLNNQYCSFLGGSQAEKNPKIDVDNNGNFYIVFYSNASPTHNGCSGVSSGNTLPLCAPTGAYSVGPIGSGDHFLMMFNTSFALQWSTSIGGTAHEDQYDLDIAVKKSSPYTLYLVGKTPDATVFNTSGASTGYQWAPSKAGDVVYIMRFDNKAYTWHTFLGCTDATTNEISITLSNNDEALVSMFTLCDAVRASGDYCKPPANNTQNPSCDNFATKYLDTKMGAGGETHITAFRPNNELFWSTNLGDGNSVIPGDIHADPVSNKIYVMGSSRGASTNFPTLKYNTNSYYQTTNLGGSSAFMTRFNLVYANSIEEIYSDNLKIKAYPNPSSSYIRLDISGLGGAESIGYELLNIHGQLLRSGVLTTQNAQFDQPNQPNQSNRIDVSTFGPGTYIINLRSNKHSGVVKFVRE